MSAQTVDDNQKTEPPESIGIFWRILGWVFAASVVGGMLYAVFIVVVVTVSNWGRMGDLGSYIGGLVLSVIVGAIYGAYLGILLALLDAIVLALLIRTRIVLPRAYRLHRIILYLIGAIITGVGLWIEMQPMAKDYPGIAGPGWIFLPTTIAALGGWWATRRALTGYLKQETAQPGTN